MALRRSFSSFFSRYLSGIDMPLLVTTVAVCLFGFFNLYGIGGNTSFFVKQGIFVVLGIAVMISFSFFNYRYFKNSSFLVFAFYVIAVVLLLMPFLFDSIRGVRSWIVLGGLTFEPAELMKIILIVLMAKYFSQRHTLINDFRHVLISGVYCMVPALITLIQPDLGSAIIITLIWVGMLLAAGIRTRHL